MVNIPIKQFTSFPHVTIQLPIYNESRVVKRLIKSVCAIDYPKDCLQIQILDDSTDVTPEIVNTIIEQYKAKGFKIEHRIRGRRYGFKAGALAEGLKTATGEYVAIFDADFLPYPEFLKETLKFFTEDSIGMVQTPWDHINRDYSFLTKAQAMFLDTHFSIEQVVRHASGRFFNFNGTAGVWRRRCIKESGGWQADTLAEDLDLSYRAQLNGWKFIYHNKKLSKAELPIQMNSFKNQQKRWIVGTLQVAKKLLAEVLLSSNPIKVKVDAFFHLTSYLIYLVSLVASVLVVPSILLRLNTRLSGSIFIDLCLFMVLTVSVFIYHLSAQYACGNRKFFKNVGYNILLVAFSMGMSISNSAAIIETFVSRKFVFYRTPKLGEIKSRSLNKERRILQLLRLMPCLEILLGIYFMIAFNFALAHSMYESLAFLGIFSIGFFYVGILSIYDYRETRVPLALKK
ncbi:glycosyltransferase [Candidatus Omnitrophota bacterium]